MALEGSFRPDQARLNKLNSQKRVIDIVVLLLSLPLTAPLFIVVYILAVIQQGRPVIYRQKRAGFHGKTFSILKIRTMTNGTDAEGNLLPDEERLTRIGVLLRKTSLDEIPQLLNVLRGEMSFVGPRPLHPQYLPYYTEVENTRHLVRPGITGLAQVSGRNDLPWEDRLALDVEYVKSASIQFDVRIVITTIAKVFQRSDIAVAPGTTGGRHLNMYRTFPELREYALRPLERGDLEERVRWITQASTRQYMSIEGEVTIESTQRWFESHLKNNMKHDFAVVEKSTGTVVGMVGMHDHAHRYGESYIMVNPDVRGKGIGEVSQQLLYEWAFIHRGYAEVKSSVHKSNPASVRIHTKLGATTLSETEDRLTLVQTMDQYNNALGRDSGIRPL